MPVPLPYPSMAKSSDLVSGSKSVKINNASVCLKNSNLAKSTGDQVGSGGGVISGKTGGKAEPLSYSFDVKFEGKNVVRNHDMFFSNQKNTPPTPIMQAPVIVSAAVSDTQEEEVDKCPYCDKPQHDFAQHWGNSVGNGQRLRKNIIDPIEDHPWYTGAHALQAHHLICSEAMDDDDWPEYCRQFGYDINHPNNGVMLPNEMALACQLHVPLHRGNHEKGMADGVSYPDRIKIKLDTIKQDIEAGKYCDNLSALVDTLDRFSKRILKKIDTFKWTITSDGKDYALGKIGCAGVSSLTKKPNTPCPHDRAHGLTQQNTTTSLPRKSSPLIIGK
ncbi:MAG: PAAR-like domain-containing protein [Pseudomonadota bacterium]